MGMMLKCTSGALAWTLHRTKPVSGILAFLFRKRPAPEPAERPAPTPAKRRRDAHGRFVSNRPASHAAPAKRNHSTPAPRAAGRRCVRGRTAEDRNRDPFAPGRLLERRTDPRLSHDFAIGDRVRHPSHGDGWVMGIPTPILPDWPEKVCVRWDRHGASFDRNCNNAPAHVSPGGLTMVRKFTPRAA